MVARKNRRVNDLATIELGGSTVVLRRAEAGDLPAIVGLLAADQLGAVRDGIRDDADLGPTGMPSPRSTATRRTSWSWRKRRSRRATLQFSFLPGLARRGALRAQVEAVRVHEDYRGCGLGQP